MNTDISVQEVAKKEKQLPFPLPGFRLATLCERRDWKESCVKNRLSGLTLNLINPI